MHYLNMKLQCLAWPVRETTKNYDDDDDMLCFAAAVVYTSLVEMCEIVSTFYPQNTDTGKTMTTTATAITTITNITASIKC